MLMKRETIRFAVLDTETTGIDPEDNELCEIAFTAVELNFATGKVYHLRAQNFEAFVNPGRPIPPEVSGIHHIIDEDVVDARSPLTAVSHMRAAMKRSGVSAIVAHNAPFDRAYIDRHLPEDERLLWICTRRLAQHVYPDAPRFSNQALRYWLKVNVRRDLPVHRALSDATVTAHVFGNILHALYMQGGIREKDNSHDMWLNELVRLTNTPALLREVRGGKYAGKEYKDLPWGMLNFLSESDDECAAFTAQYWMAPERYEPREMEALPFGKHKDVPLAEVPEDYLSWAVRQPFDDPDVRLTISKEWERRKK